MRKCVTVKPNAKVSKIQELEDGTLMAQLRSPPVDGKANTELIQLLAKTFGVSPSRITLLSGRQGRKKWVEIGED